MSNRQLLVEVKPSYSPLRLDSRGLDGELVQAILSRRGPVALTGNQGSGKTRLLRRVVPLLRRNRVRVVEVGSPKRAPLDVCGIMDQVVGPDCPDVAQDRAGRFYAVLAKPRGDETHLALLVDDAHLLTAQAVAYLELMAMAARAGPLPLQIVLVGRPHLWDRLPREGSLSSQGIAVRLVMPDVAVPPPSPGRQRVSAPAPRSRARARTWFAVGLISTVAAATVLDAQFTDEPAGSIAARAVSGVTDFLNRMASEREIASAEAASPSSVAGVGAAGAAPGRSRADTESGTPQASAVIPVSAINAPASSLAPPALPEPSTTGPVTGKRPVTGPGAAATGVPARKAEQPSPPAPPADLPGMVDVLLARGDELLATGDVGAARLMYERAARSGSARAAMAAGMTYDPDFLADIPSQGISADPETAATWYGRALVLGDPDAVSLLARVGATPKR